jgi:hypothetical protein
LTSGPAALRVVEGTVAGDVAGTVVGVVEGTVVGAVDPGGELASFGPRAGDEPAELEGEGAVVADAAGRPPRMGRAAFV